jgi:hypothetical protein
MPSKWPNRRKCSSRDRLSAAASRSLTGQNQKFASLKTSPVSRRSRLAIDLLEVKEYNFEAYASRKSAACPPRPSPDLFVGDDDH